MKGFRLGMDDDGEELGPRNHLPLKRLFAFFFETPSIFLKWRWKKMSRPPGALQVLIFLVFFALAVISFAGGSAVLAVFLVLVGWFLSAWIRVANQWDRVVVLRLGKYVGTKGPGLFFLLPVVEQPAAWVDTRVRVTNFRAEQTLTKDTVPVDVDGVFYWKAVDPERVALAVSQYETAVMWAAQTALRDIIGRSLLADMLSDRERIDKELLRLIKARIEPWGVEVESVELRDVRIPADLQNAMSREAQAERERRARVILGTAEVEIADKFREAAESYRGNPVALHLRAMNMLYEGLKEKGAMMIIPSSAVETMNLGSLAGLAALGMETTKGVDGSKEGSTA